MERTSTLVIASVLGENGDGLPSRAALKGPVKQGRATIESRFRDGKEVGQTPKALLKAWVRRPRRLYVSGWRNDILVSFIIPPTTLPSVLRAKLPPPFPSSAAAGKCGA